MQTTINTLKNLPQWVGFNSSKVPMNPHNGKYAQTNNPSTWALAADAWKAKNRYRWSGIGFVFTLESGYVGIDLDDCFIRSNGSHHFKPYAKDVVQCLDSYTEYSPSRNGVHVICKGIIQDSVKRDDIGFEMYNELRYFTVTGKEIGSSLIEERPSELQALYVTFTEERKDAPLPNIKPIHNNTNPASVKKALEYLPIHQAYYDWLRVLMAVHDAFPGNDGVTIIEAWSPGHKGEVARKFRSFERTPKDGVTIGTLFHMAKNHGYSPPTKYTKANGNLSRKDMIKRLSAA